MGTIVSKEFAASIFTAIMLLEPLWIWLKQDLPNSRLMMHATFPFEYSVFLWPTRRHILKAWNLLLSTFGDPNMTVNNVTLRLVLTTTVAVEKQWVLHTECVCSVRYPTRNAHAPYCHLWRVRLCNIFPLYLTKGTIFFKVIEHKMCVSSFSTTFVWNTINSKNWARYDRKCVKYPLFSFDFNETRIFSTDFRNILKYQISWKSVQWDRHDGANSRFFAIFANAPNIWRRIWR
jgi:hypothetical protein